MHVIRAVISRRSSIAVALSACMLLPLSVFGQEAAPPGPDEQCQDIVLPDGTVAQCPSQEASQTAAIAHAHQVDITCPAPTVPAGKRGCVLDKDVVLQAPLKLEPFTRLDCDGHALLPITDGKPLIPGPPAQAYAASVPELAILLIQAYGVTIQNCRIGSVDHPFDFGVVVLGSKLPPEVLGEQGAIHQLRNRIQANEIAGRYTGVLISQSDNNVVSDNLVDAVIGTRAGTGIDILADSDLNQITGNNVITHARADASAQNPLYPGVRVGRVRPIGIRQNLTGAAPALVNVCIGGQLAVQIAASADAIPEDSGARQQDNRVEGNFLDCGNIASPFCVATAAGAVHPRLIGNTVVGAHQALHFSGIAKGEAYPVAGHCSLDAERACTASTQCTGTDPCGNAVSKGSCIGAATFTDVSIGATEPLVTGNVVDGTAGKVEIGMYLAVPSPRATVVGNTVLRASTAGIRLNNQSLQDNTFYGNSVVESRFGLVLAQVPSIGMPGSAFGSWISRNDFVGSTRQAIATGFCTTPVTTSCVSNGDCPGSTCNVAGFPFAAELSLDGQGNHWGRACSDSNGFRGASEPDDLGKRDTGAANVNDSHPYGVPVAAGIPAGVLPCQ